MLFPHAPQNACAEPPPRAPFSPFFVRTAGKCLVFDDCYEHEVWNKTDKERVLLLFDLWHPDLVEEVRGTEGRPDY